MGKNSALDRALRILTYKGYEVQIKESHANLLNALLYLSRDKITQDIITRHDTTCY